MDASDADAATAAELPREPRRLRRMPAADLGLLTSFIGREHEVAAVCDLIVRAGVRLLTLTGPAGVGKTRLAHAVAAAARDAFADDVRFVSVAPTATPVPLAIALASALGLDEAGSRTLEEAIDHFLADRHLLLVLDNAEPVVIDGPWLAQLIAAHPGVVILATSRWPLGIYGERLVSVLPLDLPGEPLPPLPELTGFTAIRLFVERARETAPNFTLTDENAPAVAAICRRLDGLPLAIELAAARVRYLAPAPLLSLLEPRLPLLSGGSPSQPARLRSLRAAMAWSFDLLPESERVLFRRLAVFAGGFTVEAAVAVMDANHGRAVSLPVDPSTRATVLMQLATLADHSLLAAAPDEPQARFSMLETVREFAHEQLVASGEESEVTAAHAAYYLDLAERAAAELVGAEQATWVHRLRTDLANIRVALAGMLARGEIDLALRLGTALWGFWARSGLLAEGRQWLEQALGRDGTSLAAVRATAFQYLGNLALEQGDYQRADAAYQASLSLWQESEDQRGRAAALNGLGLVALGRGDESRAQAVLAEALALQEEADDRRRQALVRHNLGQVAMAAGDAATARAYHQEARVQLLALGDMVGAAYATWGLGVAATALNDPIAEPLLRQAMADFERAEERPGVGYALQGLGRLALRQGKVETARDYLRQALILRRELGDRLGVIKALEGLSEVMMRTEPERSVRLLAAAAAERDALGLPPSTVERAAQPRVQEALRTALGEAGFATAWAIGQIQPIAHAVTEALADSPAPSPTPVTAAHEVLTTREREVLRLLVAGHSDREIAAALFVSPKTASNHVANILAKLGVPTRTAAATRALRDGLV